MPPREKPTLYDALGIDQRASPSDIGRIYRRLKSEMEGEHAAPNPRRLALIRQAYEVLSDKDKRAAYDKSIKGEKFLGVKPGASPTKKFAMLGVVVAAGLGAAWWFTLGNAPKAVKQGKGASLDEIRTAASLSVGRVSRVEMSGSRTNLSAAVAIEEGVMIAPCAGIDPGAQLMVRIPPRDIPAQVKQVDESAGLCRLALSGGGSWPLAMTTTLPRAGDKVYAASLGSLGEVVLIPGEVRKVVRGERGNIVDSTAKVGSLLEGTPLLDKDGRIIAVALKGEHTMLPNRSVVDTPPAKRPPVGTSPAAASEAAPAAAEAAAATVEEDPRLKNVSPEKRERMEKSFRPPPSVPKDL